MKIVFIADGHVGHELGLANPEWTPKYSAGKPVQKALYQAYCDAVNKSGWKRPDALVSVGDWCDGQGKRRGGAEQWTTDFDEQAEYGAELLRMWDAKRYYVILGTGYHGQLDRTGCHVEEYMARTLNAEEYPNQGHLPKRFRKRSGYHWYLSFEGLTFHVQHKVSVSRVFHYRSTPIARQMLGAKLNDALRHEQSEYRTNIVIRAHAHYYWMCGSGASAGFDLPCWQALSPFMQETGAVDISPDIGFVGFEVNGKDYRYEKVLWTLEDVQVPPHTVVGRRGKRRTRRDKGG